VICPIISLFDTKLLFDPMLMLVWNGSSQFKVQFILQLMLLSYYRIGAISSRKVLNASIETIESNNTRATWKTHEQRRSQLLCRDDTPRCSNTTNLILNFKSSRSGNCVEICATESSLDRYSSLRFNCGLCPAIVNNTTLKTSAPTNGPVTNRSPPSIVPVTFKISLALNGMSALDKAVLKKAAKRWSDIIVADVEDVSTQNMVPSIPGCKYPSMIDDLHICSEFNSVDGQGGILGYAGPDYVRLSNGLPIMGSMSFDTADIEWLRQDESLYNVILHEMGHILGIGSLWKQQQVTGKASANCPYKGSSNAAREYRALTGCKTAPTEQDGGDGTRCSHFDEDCMDTELMTGYLNGSPALSRITIGSLQDLGYSSVDYNQADTYTRQSIKSSCWCNRRLRERSEADNVPKRRKLSEEGMLVAKAYGTSLLLARSRQNSVVKEISKLSSSSSNFKYVGDERLSILYLEENNIYEVSVSTNDTN
jgi:Leishmanolysin